MKLGLMNTKGGTGSTTTAIYLGMLLHRDARTLVVDSDPQGSLMSWSERAEEDGDPLPFTVISLPVRDLHKRLADLAADYQHVVIDTPPGDVGIIRSAIMAVDTVLVPVAPTGLDLDRVKPTFELLAEAEPFHPVSVGVLLVKVRRGTKSAAVAREKLAELGYPLLDTEIHLAEHYAGSFGLVPADLGEYADLMMELTA